MTPAPPQLSAQRGAFTLAELLVALALLAPLMAAGFAWQHAALAGTQTARDRERWIDNATLVLASIEARALRDGVTARDLTLDLDDLRLTFDVPHLRVQRTPPGLSASPAITLLDHLAEASVSPAPPRILISLRSTWGDRIERFIAPRGAAP